MSLSAQDKLDIQELSSKYAIALDNGNIEAWLQTWAPDGVWEGGAGKYEGLERLRQLLPDLGERIQGKRHIMTNFVISGDGNRASQTCYLLIVDIFKAHLPGTAVYTDKLEKIQDNWLFAHRKVVLDL
jgi:3-phenylpropionate/cinnamic acid dioxygenase small subunit